MTKTTIFDLLTDMEVEIARTNGLSALMNILEDRGGDIDDNVLALVCINLYNNAQRLEAIFYQLNDLLSTPTGVKRGELVG